MTRIIAGSARGRRLAVPPGSSTRPTSDRAREGLFATTLAIRGTLAGAAVLGLHAGSGAVGLGALSRGAADALLLESGVRAAKVLWDNTADVGLGGAHLVAYRMYEDLSLDPGYQRRRDFVFADPPY